MIKVSSQRTFSIQSHTGKGLFGEKVVNPFFEITDILCGLSVLDRMYKKITEHDLHQFIKRALSDLGISYVLSENDLKQIPSQGALVITANHPYGGIEGLIIADILLSVRPDIKIMANQLLARISELKRIFIFVDPFDRPGISHKRNIAPLRESLKHLKAGGALGIFPAGEVAHFSLSHMQVREGIWAPNIAKLIRSSEATVLPVYFSGTNRPLFHAVGMIHPMLRTAMLPRELYNKSNKQIEVRIGTAIQAKQIAALGSDTEVMMNLRSRSLLMKHRDSNQRKIFQFKYGQEKKQVPIIDAVPAGKLSQEISGLSKESMLYQSEEYAVYHARINEASLVMEEISRLREKTFRSVAEGTGKCCDLDSFDQYYTQLFVWNNKKEEIVGAYRLVKTDEVIRKQGYNGLYSNSLFNYDPGFFNKIGPALELGRSFVRQEYQKDFSPLFLLWKGIGAYVLKYPQYKTLFGLVSISNEYKAQSRQMMAAYFESRQAYDPLKQLVSPKNSLKINHLIKKFAESSLKDEADLSRIIHDIDPGRTIPPLLRQYLKMGGRILGFNVDSHFSNTLDGLIVVDLTKTELKHLVRYMGPGGAQRFISLQNILSS